MSLKEQIGRRIQSIGTRLAATKMSTGGVPVAARGRQSEAQWSTLDSGMSSWQAFYGQTAMPTVPEEVVRFLIQASYLDADLSMARKGLKHLAATPLRTTVTGRSEADTRAIRARLDDYNKRVGILNLTRQYLDQLISSGAICKEAVIGNHGDQVEEIVLIPSYSIQFKMENRKWIPHQKTSRGQFIRMDIPTFGYYPLETIDGAPYAIPPMLAAAKYVLMSAKADKNIEFILAKLGLLGVFIDKMNSPEGYDWQNPKDVANFNAIIAQRAEDWKKNYYNGIMVKPNDGDTVNHNPAGDARGSYDLVDRVREQIYGGVGINGGVFGQSHHEIQSFASVVYRGGVRYAETIQLLTAAVIEEDQILELMLGGFDPTGVHSEFEANSAYDPQAEAQGRSFRISSDISAMERGIISPDEVAQEHYHRPAYDASRAYSAVGGMGANALLKEHGHDGHDGRYGRKRGIMNLADSGNADPQQVIEGQVSRYVGRMAEHVAGARERAVEAAMGVVDQYQNRTFQSGEEFAQRVWPAIEAAIIGVMGTEEVKRIADTAANEFYRYWRLQDRSAFANRRGLTFSFGVPDVRTSQFAGRLDGFFFSTYVNNDEVGQAAMNYLRTEYMERGAGLYGRQDVETLNGFRRALGLKLDEINLGQVQRIADTSVARLRHWGNLSQMDELGITRGVVIADGGACDICLSYNGVAYDIGAEVQQMRRNIEMTPEEYLQVLRGQEAVRQSYGSAQAHLNSGMAGLPRHPHCACKLISEEAYNG